MQSDCTRSSIPASRLHSDPAACPCSVQALPAAHLSLNKTIWEIVTKEHRTSQPPAVNSTGRGGGVPATAAYTSATDATAGSNGADVLRPKSWNLLNVGLAPPGSAGAAAGRSGLATCGPPPAVWVAVRCNYTINVLLAYQVDPGDW